MAVRSRTRKAARRATPKTKKWVYLFADKKAEGNAKMRDLLGGKGAGLAEMTNAGLPVPAGFTITTAACNAYFAWVGSSRRGSGTRLKRRSRRSSAPRRRSSA